jgi:hypothetical protein
MKSFLHFLEEKSIGNDGGQVISRQHQTIDAFVKSIDKVAKMSDLAKSSASIDPLLNICYRNAASSSEAALNFGTVFVNDKVGYQKVIAPEELNRQKQIAIDTHNQAIETLLSTLKEIRYIGKYVNMFAKMKIGN